MPPTIVTRLPPAGPWRCARSGAERRGAGPVAGGGAAAGEMESTAKIRRSFPHLAGRATAAGRFISQHHSRAARGDQLLCDGLSLPRAFAGFRALWQQLDRAIDYVLSCQKEDGLLCLEAPEPQFMEMRATHTGSYNHAIAGLMLGEVYGHVTGQRAKNVRAAINKALHFSRTLQTREKPFDSDLGGWRYLRAKPGEPDSDLSITAWNLMFYRSARNAEFNVPQEYVDQAVSYVRRCWNSSARMFHYAATSDGGYGDSRGMTGAGILALSLAGQHNTGIARAAGDWLVAHPYTTVHDTIGDWDRCFYSTYYCSQAAAQLGGRYWEQIFPPIIDMFLRYPGRRRLLPGRSAAVRPALRQGLHHGPGGPGHDASLSTAPGLPKVTSNRFRSLVIILMLVAARARGRRKHPHARSNRWRRRCRRRNGVNCKNRLIAPWPGWPRGRMPTAPFPPWTRRSPA